MKIQNSRNSRQPLKDYSSVCHQQGRMLTDSDLTEQALLSRDRLNEALRDVIGSGTPRHGALLQVTESGDERIPSLHWGRVYVDGILGEVRADVDAPDADAFDYAHQDYFPEAPERPETAHRLYVDVWERSVIWLEDEMLRDPGLHGADTSTRTQTTAQVKWCAADIDPLCADVNPTLGDARLRLVLRSLASGTDQCDPCADELELNDPVGNYLFRVEVHDVGFDADDHPVSLVLKWSSENGAEAYSTADVPPDFASGQFVYEFFDEVTEKRLGLHLGRDGANQRYIDGARKPLVNEFSDSSPQAKVWVRRWDGWCRIEKSGADWRVTEGFEGNIDLTSGVGADKPGHVEQGGDSVGIELRVISLELELADHPLVPGDYWNATVRETIHQQGEVLLEDPESGAGVPPAGEPHHYLLLAEVASDGSLSLPAASGCDGYAACQPFQFPSLTDLRASDICFDNKVCTMPEVRTVQQALDHLCQERDLRWHNRHLHGWGVVCGLTLECDTKDPAGLLLNPGYALDCLGNDMVVEEKDKRLRSLNVFELMQASDIDPANLGEDQGLCLYLEFDEQGELAVRAELYEPDGETWLDLLRDTLLFDFYDDCIVGLIKSLTAELQNTDVKARCVLTKCGLEQIKPVQRRALTLGNLLFQQQQGETGTVLNISYCEHEILRDLYLRLREHLRSRTFCAQFEESGFPDYPFSEGKLCRATWFNPEPLDHIRLHPKGGLAFAWRRSSPRVYLFEQQEKGCLGDLLGYFEVPQAEKGSITDLSINEDNLILISAVVHDEDTLFAGGKLGDLTQDGCEIKIDWRTSFMCGVRVVRLRQSPWSTKQLYAVGLCKGVYLVDPEELFQQDKIERDPNWVFAASGHIDFLVRSGAVICTAAGGKADCAQGQYDQLALFNAALEAGAASQAVSLLDLQVNKNPAMGSDGLVAAESLGGNVSGGAFIAFEVDSSLAVFVVIDVADKKFLCRFDASGLKADEKGGGVWQGQFYHPFEAAGHVALRYVRGGKLDGVVATRYAFHDLQYIPGDAKQYPKELVATVPVQAGPVDLEVNDKREEVHVLNHLGQSITVLNYELSVYQEQRPILQAYRTDVISAFYGLLSGLLQYLKDCFCNHLLIQCPECDPEDKVYLGCLSLRDGKVYNICNFTKRKFVKTFPSVSYWLSLIPIGPLVAWAVEKLCCMLMPNLFQRKQSMAFAVSPQQFGLASAVLHTDHSNLLRTVSLASQDLGRKSLSELVRAGYKDSSSFQDLSGVEYQYKPGVKRTIQPAFTSNEMLRQQIDQMQLERVKAQGEVSLMQAELSQLKAEKQAANERVAQLEAGMLEFTKLREMVEPMVIAAQPVGSIEGITAEQAKLLEDNRITTVRQLADADAATLKTLGIQDSTANNLIKMASDRLVIKR